MPWTRTRLSWLRKIAIGQAPCAASSAARRAAPSIVSTSSTMSCSASSRIRRPSSALLPSSRTTSGLSIVLALRLEHLQRLDDAAGDRVAGGDPAEHVHEHAADGRVAEDDLQPVGHHVGRGAAADVEEVGRLHAAELLARVRDDVERAHHETGAVADDPDLAVELDVVEALRLGLGLERVGGMRRRRTARARAGGSRRSRRA